MSPQGRWVVTPPPKSPLIMPNKNYQKGRRKEYKIKKELEESGYIVLRTAGSHGFADLIAIKPGRTCHKGEIKFIQCKPDNFSAKEANDLIKEYSWIDGTKNCIFMIL